MSRNKIVELDKHLSMTPEQALVRAGREDYLDIVIIGHTGDQLVVITSEIDASEIYFTLSRILDDLLRIED